MICIFQNAVRGCEDPADHFQLIHGIARSTIARMKIVAISINTPILMPERFQFKDFSWAKVLAQDAVHKNYDSHKGPALDCGRHE